MSPTERKPAKPAKSAKPARQAKSLKPKSAARPRRKKSPGPLGIPEILKLGVAAANDKQAVDLLVLDLRKATAFTDFFVICTGTNLRQVQAIADAIQERLRADGQRPALVEGYNRGDWVLVDYFDVVFHIFTPTTREFYTLERLWGDAEKIVVSA